MTISQGILSTLLAVTIELSGLPGIDVKELPVLVRASEAELAALACPDQPDGCRSMAALFDTERYRILLRTSLDLDMPLDSSFLVHELVHVLQFKRFGHARFTRCEDLLNSEREAYDVQNAYLRRQGIFWREGETLRYMRCPPDEQHDKPAAAD